MGLTAGLEISGKKTEICCLYQESEGLLWLYQSDMQRTVHRDIFL